LVKGYSKYDITNQYLAYHEGHGGYQHKSYLKKPWLIKIPQKVKRQEQLFKQQLSKCKAEFKSTSWFFW